MTASTSWKFILPSLPHANSQKADTDYRNYYILYGKAASYTGTLYNQGPINVDVSRNQYISALTTPTNNNKVVLLARDESNPTFESTDINEELTLEGIQQFYISLELDEFKFETLCDLSTNHAFRHLSCLSHETPENVWFSSADFSAN